ncbi:hypothetical protein [Salinibacter phage M8CC-19]|uniref:dATP/dGTP diphosphohydrolase N-terminal domain-containing protein n=2 Tax=Kryptosalinivirus M8CC19 TaxID=2560720 RepID=A0A2I6UG56_9CAUD|nr:hypothetical protein FGG63_gp32 [Salinibacter phage M8CC-19]AUO78964.1 hypothetical protein [Salinibacter phage M8CC-19]AUO79198.1 hypothetical protein [Salinibacter phage M31CC-1]
MSDMRTNEDNSKGVKFDAGKPRLDLIPERTMFDVGHVFGHGADKYDRDEDGNPTTEIYRNNWREGMRHGRVAGAALRHIFAWKQGEDFDPDSGLPHLAHAICSLMMLNEYAYIFPEGDDRAKNVRRPIRYILDIDGVLANFADAFRQLAVEIGAADDEELGREHRHWHFPFDASPVWDEVNEAFWLTLAPLITGDELEVEPTAYITSRPVESAVSEAWLTRHRFPNRRVFTVNGPDGKVEAMRELRDIYPNAQLVMVDDHYENFRKLRNAGFSCFLLDRPYNRKHKVGHFRLDSLNDLVNETTY